MLECPPILVAEDDDDDFHFLRLAIRGADITTPVLRFRDGSELIKFLEQIPPAELGDAAGAPWLLLLDIGMPLMNGFEVLKWIQSHKGLPQLRAVVLSGFYHPADVERATSLGATEYLVKPITRQALSGIISRHASQLSRA
ncbi:MAG TPA: response regulator [Opitutaceae bacterium]|nr:response regulator [Opitutaceae bacterium]